MTRPDYRDPPTIAEIAELTARLRRLSALGAAADDRELAAFLADRDALLARIDDALVGHDPRETYADDEHDQGEAR